MHHNQKGFTLVELLVGLAISSIIIAAAYASYIVIKNNYDFQKDMKNISQSSRAVATMIMRDVRMAGYNFDDGPTKQNPVITTPIKITDGGSTSPDSIEIIYDQSFTERLKISYYSKPYPNTSSNRSRLYKKVERCDPSVNCSAGSLTTVIPESPIADYVEDLQFLGFKNGNQLGLGAIKFGQGNMRWISPSSIKANCGGQTHLLYDNNLDTVWGCSTSPFASLEIKFPNPVRITKIRVVTGAHLDGGTLGGNFTYPFPAAVYPYGILRQVLVNGDFTLVATDATCAWSSTCNLISNADANFNCAGKLGELDILGKGGSNGCAMPGSNSDEIGKNATKRISARITNGQICTYTNGSQPCTPQPVQSKLKFLAEIQFFGEVYGEAQDPQEVEIGLLIRSPDEHGSTPVAQTFTLGNRTINTNDNYIRDAYGISALVRNKFYE